MEVGCGFVGNSVNKLIGRFYHRHVPYFLQWKVYSIMNSTSERSTSKSWTQERIESEDEAEETAILVSLDALALQREQQLDNIACVRATESAGKRLDGYVLVELQAAGKRKPAGKYASRTIAKSRISCEVIADTAIRAAFTETETTILKSEAIRHYKSTGEIIDGCVLFRMNT